MRAPLRFLALGLAGALLTVSAANAKVPCLDEAEARLSSLDLDRDTIKSVSILKVVSNPNFDTPIGYDVWVSLHNCKGNLVFQMSKLCTVKQAFTRGGCQVAGVARH